MDIVSSSRFKQQFKKLLKSEEKEYWIRLELLIKDARHPLLYDHKLHGKWGGYRSINISGDKRLIYKKLDNLTWYVAAIGTHHQLFGS